MIARSGGDAIVLMMGQDLQVGKNSPIKRQCRILSMLHWRKSFIIQSEPWGRVERMRGSMQKARFFISKKTGPMERILFCRQCVPIFPRELVREKSAKWGLGFTPFCQPKGNVIGTGLQKDGHFPKMIDLFYL